MNIYGIEVDVGIAPPLDPGFIPLNRFNQAFLQTATQPLGLALERSNGQVAIFETKIHGTAQMANADRYYVNRLLKTMLWLYGGYQIYICGSHSMLQAMQADFSIGGCQDFDVQFMSKIYEQPFHVVGCDQLPKEKGGAKSIGRHLDGCRIGFDAGGSDRKVSAVVDGETVFSQEVVWFPKVTADPDYHYDGIVSAFQAAASHMPRVDAVGISSAGVYIDDRTMAASLFLAVPPEQFDEKVKDIYIRAVKDTFGDIPYAVANDGDVSALAGAMNLEKNNVLGLAMGTSEAVGFVDDQGRITGWLNELAFVPVDGSPAAMMDEWSLDIGCGVKYFSQDSVIKLAPAAGIVLDKDLSPAEKLKVMQAHMAADHPGVADLFRTIGVYLGHTLAYYHSFYRFDQVLLLGRVMSGKGGDILIATAKEILAKEYGHLSISLELPDEKARRVGQSVAAASLPQC